MENKRNDKLKTNIQRNGHFHALFTFGFLTISIHDTMFSTRPMQIENRFDFVTVLR